MNPTGLLGVDGSRHLRVQSRHPLPLVGEEGETGKGSPVQVQTAIAPNPKIRKSGAKALVVLFAQLGVVAMR